MEEHQMRMQQINEEWKIQFDELQKECDAYRHFFRNVVKFNDQVTSKLQHELGISGENECLSEFPVVQPMNGLNEGKRQALGSSLDYVSQNDGTHPITPKYTEVTQTTSENICDAEFLRLARLYDQLNFQLIPSEHTAPDSTTNTSSNQIATHCSQGLQLDTSEVCPKKLLAKSQIQNSPETGSHTNFEETPRSESNNQQSSSCGCFQDSKALPLNSGNSDVTLTDKTSDCLQNVSRQKLKRRRKRKRNGKRIRPPNTSGEYETESNDYPLHAVQSRRSQQPTRTEYQTHNMYEQNRRPFEVSNTTQFPFKPTFSQATFRKVQPFPGVFRQPVYHRGVWVPIPNVPAVNVLERNPSISSVLNANTSQIFCSPLQANGFQPCRPQVITRIKPNVTSHPPVFGQVNRDYAIPAYRRFNGGDMQLPQQQPLQPRFIPVYLMCSAIRLLKNASCILKPCQIKPAINRTQQRCLWAWLNSVFNRVDPERVKEVGPDRACAEWLLRSGGCVKWKDRHWEKDYNQLVVTHHDLKIEEIDATGASVMSVGFPHLNGLKHVKKIVLHDCQYLDDSSLSFLPILKNTLQHLQVSTCGNITNRGIEHITELEKLQTLILFNLPEVRDEASCLKMLQKCLPSCDISFVDAEKEKSKS